MPTTRKKCYSKCRKKTENACGPKICKYVKGKKYQYCRLGYKYKLDSNCNITKRRFKTTMTKKKARLNINSFVNKSVKNKKSSNNNNNNNNNNNISNSTAAKKIQNFMNKNKIKIKSRFLQSICSDSGVCLAFGKKSKDIKDFFSNFVDFKYATSSLKRIGNPSANGFVNEVSYEREKYRAHSIIKSSTKKNADNLFYEYLCGLTINNWSTQFPCFLETYGLFSYKNNTTWNKTKNNRTTSISSFQKYVNLLSSNKLDVDSSTFDDLLNKSCVNSNHISLMIQHIKNAETLQDFFDKQRNKNYFVDNHLVIILFQLYFPLHVLRNNFTHYDFHTNNVLIYKPYSNGYINYNYVLSNGQTIRFKSPYMVKIIDYGRCYFKNDDYNYNSNKILNKICRTKECNPECGEKYGYSWLNRTGPLRQQLYILSSVSNKSHDLRLLNIFKSHFKTYNINKPNRNIKSLYNNIINKVKYNTNFGTPKSKNNKYPNKIETVSDAFRGLFDLIMDSDFAVRNNNDIDSENLVKIGDLYIYEDERPMRFSN